ncbi:uncharacterized protein I303_103768 [Kwoniella dejecticola CBS 10117]|uniref:NmrA-like domain-containing protein n=1 Tax=Kwoniella dejecticola CBS 10117 TaxID=1296121 RepID=A0A1A6A7N6_9TREE|nr:uncharacterized protein I303_03786 [Kwoniella dejecticola CBS 10117]OBR86068.1 hypothetical protein I303_03786 [Kwoniella dejecticola CBS 10117]
MSSVPVIGHIGYSGLVGKSILTNLLEHHKAGKVRLVVLYREGSDLSQIPDDVEKRLVQLDDSGAEQNKKAVEGLEVLLSTVGAAGLKAQTYLIDALEGSKALKTFVHSDFGTNWSAKELEAPGLAVIKVKEHVVEHAEKKGVPITNIRVGAFDVYVFKFQAGGTDIKGNKQQIFRNSLKNPLRITSIPYLGYATAQLLLKPQQLVNQTIQLYDFSPTGQDFVDALTKINGSQAVITHYSEEQYQADLKAGPGQAIGAAIKAKWGDDNWGPDGVPDIEGWKSKSFEELAKEWAAQV